MPIRSLLLALVLVSTAGCATYQGKVFQARQLLQAGNPTQAAEMLKPLALEEGKDQLVYLFDYATALQESGQLKESNDAFLLADKLTEWKDYHSISKQATSLLFAEEMTQYKGDDYEKVLINAMLALNFLELKDYDSALVETRRINEKIDYFRREGKKSYSRSVFAVYLGALIWEHNRDWDDAYIAFSDAYKIDPTIPYLKEDLVLAARRAHRSDAAKKWQTEFGVSPPQPKNNYGELVLIYLQGWGPRKYPRPDSPRFPYLRPVYSYTQQAKLLAKPTNNNGKGAYEEHSQVIYDIEHVAIRTLEDDYAALVAKRMAGIVAKEVAAHQLRQNDQALGDIAAIIMHASDRADLRQWSTLPQTFQVAKIKLPAGKYSVEVQGLGTRQKPTGEAMAPTEVSILPKRKAFVLWRSFR
ncbi:MAG: hypothetical protein H6626_10600 [Pseudobdellovibrionaceae bacterium]|nr:hypothetical protein [Bdellovibrionales bacterium]USN46656.1 MAG: hypothetical protein H6626_10600 [Pseudobdellovibrionaceae bacterium]